MVKMSGEILLTGSKINTCHTLNASRFFIWCVNFGSQTFNNMTLSVTTAAATNPLARDRAGEERESWKV